MHWRHGSTTAHCLGDTPKVHETGVLGSMAALPACLHLSLAAPLVQRPSRSVRQQRLVTCTAERQQQQRPPVAPASLAPRGGPPQHHLQQPPRQDQQPQKGGKHPMQGRLNAAFDAALDRGHLDRALAVLQEGALAARGAALPLLGPDRNRRLIHACFNSRRPEKAVAYLQLLHPLIAPWSAVMKEANQRRDVATLQRVLAARQAAGLPLDHKSATAAITGLSASGRLPDALATFCRAWESRECRTVETVNAAIAACAAHGSWEAAQEVLSIMHKEGIQPDIITYNSLLKAAGAAGLVGEALRLYREVQEAGLRPTTFTYASLFNAAAKARHGDLAWLLQVRWAVPCNVQCGQTQLLQGVRAVQEMPPPSQSQHHASSIHSAVHCTALHPPTPLLQTFDEMTAARVEPNNYVVSALFSAASFAPASPAQLDRLFAALALLRSFGPPNDNVYTALLTLIQRQAIPERAVDVWTAVKQDGVRQSPHLFSSLFAGERRRRRVLVGWWGLLRSHRCCRECC